MSDAPPRDDLTAAKAALRAEAVTRRAKLFASLGPRAGDALRDVVVAHLGPVRRRTVSGFWPMGEEIDLRPTLAALHGTGAEICLPVVVARGRPLIFRRWTPDTVLEQAAFGVSIPPTDASLRDPDILLVPLLAFDRSGHRLGYGGGFYDRTLAAARAARAVTALGVAFAGQEVHAVPHGPHDVRLDAIATEAGLIEIQETH